MELRNGSVVDPAIIVDARRDVARILGGDQAAMARELAGEFPDQADRLLRWRGLDGTYPAVAITGEGAVLCLGESWGRQVYHGFREQAEVAYLRARRRGLNDPVILVDTRNQAERHRRVARERALPEGFRMGHATVTLGSRPEIAAGLAPMSRGAAEFVASGPFPERPFTVIVVGDPKSIEVFNEPEPQAGDAM